MKILADLHHAELYYSLQLLFEKRLGAELYRPIGMDWYHQGFWHVYPHIDTAKQFLGTDQSINIPKDVHGNPLPRGARVNEEYRFEDGIYYVTDVTKNKIQRGITLDKFKEMEFDVLVSSMPQHIEPFNELIRQFQPKAKHVFQVGNAWGHQPGVNNILASCAEFPTPPGINTCFYHQEFDLETFCYEKPDYSAQPAIYSYIHYMRKPELFGETAIALPEFQFRSFGAGMEDSILLTQNLADKMRSSKFTWHYKPEGDGFGHVLHNSFAVGRPPIIWLDHYRGKLAERLFLLDQNCIVADGLPSKHLAEKIRDFSRPEKHREMCLSARAQFERVVDFEAEEKNIRSFLANLK